MRNTVMLVLLLGCCCTPRALLACRYNVRDIGFVDLDTAPYLLYAFVRKDTPSETVSTLRDTAAVMLADTNLRFETVNVDQEQDHPALKHYAARPPDSYPAILLVSPDGQSLPLALSPSASSFRQAWMTLLQQVVSSPQREEILRQVGRAFGVVLLIEGSEPEENRRVRKVISSAIDQIKTQMRTLPKSIARPPVMVALEAASRAREAILLWSLRCDPAAMKSAGVAVIYGRARWMGPLMKGEEITAPNLVGILSIVGADCECGMDLSWTQGTRLPVKWDALRQTEVARALGFDPENPTVKIEVSRILGRSDRLTSSAVASADRSVESGSSVLPALAADPRHLDNGSSRVQPRTGKATTSLGVVSGGSILRPTLILLGTMAAVVLVIGLGILVRAARKK